MVKAQAPRAPLCHGRHAKALWLTARRGHLARRAAIQAERVTLNLARVLVSEPRTSEAQHHGVLWDERLRGIGAQRVQALPVFQTVPRRAIRIGLAHERAAVSGRFGRLTRYYVTNTNQPSDANQSEPSLVARTAVARCLCQRTLARALTLGREMPALRVDQLSFSLTLTAGKADEEPEGQQRKDGGNTVAGVAEAGVTVGSSGHHVAEHRSGAKGASNALRPRRAQNF